MTLYVYVDQQIPQWCSTYIWTKESNAQVQGVVLFFRLEEFPYMKSVFSKSYVRVKA